MMEINQNATELSQSDINLGYLEINKNLNEAASQLKEAEHRIDVGNLKEAQMMISQIGDGVLKLQDAISQEKAAYDEIHGGLEQNLITVSEIQVELNDIKKMYSNIRDRFGLEDWTHRFALADEQMGNVQEASTLLQREIKADQTPLIEVVRYYREFVADINEFKTQIDEMKSKLISASSDESRAQKQLIKLQLILNEVRLNAATRHLPSISSQFEKDIQQAEDLISRVQIVLSHSPLDVPTLNADLQDAIDFVYKLYNNANNLIGVAVMVENAIVFGNRFRSAHPSMNTDLTRAELCFQNGEYTRALKIAIQAIENLHPGTYEKLIAKKDPAVMNQV